MNQILYAEEEKKTTQIDVKKVVLFFAISIIMFGMVLLVMSGYSLNKYKKNEKVITPVEEKTNNITVELTEEEDSKVMIKIESDLTISYITYTWNNEAPQTIDETGKTSIEEIIEIPVGENSLEVSVVDEQGNESKKTATYTRKSAAPIIEAGSTAGNYYIIKITSENELDYVTYKWNNENEVKEDMYTYENKNSFEKKIEVPTGVNTLLIKAVDVLGEETIATKNITGYQKPVTSVVEENGYLAFTVTGEDNIETVKFKLNGNEYIMTKNTFGETKVVKYKVKMIEGWNYLEITATTEKEATKTTYWKYEL